jgi:23S rRNA pseudouridine1911/1915/1917 synthase
MKSLGHILLGDVVYGWKPDPRLKHPPERVMLHAAHLVFQHPITKKTLDLHAPLPPDFEAQVKELRSAARAEEKVKRVLEEPVKPKKKAAPPSYHEHESRK